MTLKDLKIGESATITSVAGSGALRRHILDMGILPGTRVTLTKMAPMGDPMELKVRDYELTLRLADAENIGVDDIGTDERKSKSNERLKPVEHKGLGEMGAYHPKPSGESLGANDMITFALAGNQNCGKTTLFNQLTGSNQHVGNFPGVTVDKKDGPIRGQKNTSVTDLPGIYSMSPYTSEELVTREFVLNDKPGGIINIVDATNLERNLYLTMQLMELDIPMVLALNMMDEVRENGGTIMVNKLEDILGIPVVPISAAKNEGIDELIEHAMHVARFRESPGRIDFCLENDSSQGAVHRCIHSIMHLIDDHAKKVHIPVRFAAGKLIEGDTLILDQLELDENEKNAIDHIIEQMERESGRDRESAIANMRFDFIEKVCDATVIRPHESKAHIRSVKIDKVLTGKWTAIPFFAGIMGLIFWLSFSVIGDPLSDLLAEGIDRLTELCDMGLSAIHLNPVVQSLIIDGIFAGVGSVLSFIPYIVTLFFFLSILEDSGYMARIAFVMDKLLRKLGLSGRSFVPMIIGFGCSVPAIMATRTLPSERDRKMTILLTPFMSCTAKLPIYALFTAAFFPDYGALVMVGLYFTGIIVAILYAMILKNTKFKGEPVPFVMELPNYRFPSAKSVVHLIWDKAKDFINKAFSIIFIASIVIWFLQTFDIHLNIVSDSSDSLLALLGGFIAPIFKPLGFGDWRISTALITGFMAKESVVSTMTVLLGGSAEALATVFTPATAFVFLIFTLLYTPCVAAISSVKRELGGKWAVVVVILQCVIAWLTAFLAHCVCVLII